jgi:SAM-dependent methyltransferase
MIDYDAELCLYNIRLRASYDIGASDRVLDIGCGAGQTTREVARLAADGNALGIDTNPKMIARARQMAHLEALWNVRFETGDAETYPFGAGAFDTAISRFGTMFFANPLAAFRNIAVALRPGGRLLMMVWQDYGQNEWAGLLDDALSGNGQSFGTDQRSPFSLGNPATVQRLLGDSGFRDVDLTDVKLPVYYGPDIESAFAFVSSFGNVSLALRSPEPGRAASVTARLRTALAARSSARGIWLKSSAWIVSAVRI